MIDKFAIATDIIDIYDNVCRDIVKHINIGVLDSHSFGNIATTPKYQAFTNFKIAKHAGYGCIAMTLCLLILSQYMAHIYIHWLALIFKERNDFIEELHSAFAGKRWVSCRKL